MTNPVTRLKDFVTQFTHASSKKSSDEPFVFEEDDTLSLHFDPHTVQSVMQKSSPNSLLLGYTRTMMGFLLFKSEPKSIAMIGLGGGSLAKYCVKYLPNAHFTAVEINPKVIALREKFHIPADGEKFIVLHANGADYVANKLEKVDVLLVDGYDENGQSAKLCSVAFYDNCYDKLNEGGVMVVNLHGSDIKFGTYTSRMRASFDDKVVVVDAEKDGNKIAFAYKGKNFPLSGEALLERISILGPKHPITLHNTAQKIQQRLNTHVNLSEWEHVIRNAL
jgi:spermidine synthase